MTRQGQDIRQHAATQSNVVAMPVISRNVKAFASSGTGAALANNANYDDQWVSGSLPAWLAYDLSTVPVTNRGRVAVAWYPINLWANPTALPKNYTIEGNPADGGASSAPTSGWVVLTTITNNTEQWREHVVDMTGMNWIRINITASSGGNVGLNFDVHDAHQGTSDTWIFEGDGFLPAMWNVNEGAPSFPQQVEAAVPPYHPIQEAYGRDGDAWCSCNTNIKSWLAAFPDVKFVGLQYGPVEAKNGTPPYYIEGPMRSCINQIIAAGKYPAVPTVIYGTQAGTQASGPGECISESSLCGLS